jgi:hypothetical protein
MSMPDFGAKCCLQICRHQCRGNTFTTNVSDCDPEFTTWKSEEIIKIAAHRLSLTTHRATLNAFEWRNSVREESLLDDSWATAR